MSSIKFRPTSSYQQLTSFGVLFSFFKPIPQLKKTEKGVPNLPPPPFSFHHCSPPPFLEPLLGICDTWKYPTYAKTNRCELARALTHTHTHVHTHTYTRAHVCARVLTHLFFHHRLFEKLAAKINNETSGSRFDSWTKCCELMEIKTL